MPYFKLKNGNNIFYIDEGKGNIILFLHCWAGNHNFWHYQIKEFKKNYRCIAIDFPGHGKSDEQDRYGPYPFAELVSEFISQPEFKKEKFIIAGHSLGGMTAMQSTLEYKDKVRALILIDTSAYLLGHLGQNVASPAIAFFTPAFTDMIKRYGIYLTALHPFARFEEKKFVADEAMNVSNHVLTQTAHGINQFNVKDMLKDIDIPALIVVGTLDFYTDIRHSITMKLGIKNSKLVIIPFAGHCSILEKPEKVNCAMRKFVESFE